MTSRHTSIDIARGIGILFVVFGHNWIVGHEKGKLFNIIFSFHIPLFFFLSGLFMTQRNGLRVYVIKKLDTLMKPYFVILFLVGLFIIPHESVNPLTYLARIVYGTGPILPSKWLQLWFLPHLWVVSVLSYLCYMWANLESKTLLYKATFLIIIITIGSLGVQAFWNKLLPGTGIILPGLPFSLDIILISTFYFILGSFLKESVLNLKFNWLMFIIAAFSFLFIHLLFDYTIDLNMRRYDHVFFSTITALIGIYLVISLSSLLASKPIISKFLSYIGTASLIILIFHRFIQIKIFKILSSMTSSPSVINALLSFVVAVSVSLLINELIKKYMVVRRLFLPVN
jgi:polysaccharide biosynthesis protein PslL